MAASTLDGALSPALAHGAVTRLCSIVAARKRGLRETADVRMRGKMEDVVRTRGVKGCRPCEHVG